VLLLLKVIESQAFIQKQLQALKSQIHS
jgi:hypothetical protein